MNEYVTDTHSLLWYLLAAPALSAKAKNAFDEAANGAALIYIPSIVLAELYFLNVKQKHIIDFGSEFQKIRQSGQFVSVPFDSDDVLDFDKDSAVKEMHDRMIVGVARRLNATLLTKDQNIINSNTVKTIW
jgi:PIN domain nuclease of toxin-antitoxin system